MVGWMEGGCEYLLEDQRICLSSAYHPTTRQAEEARGELFGRIAHQVHLEDVVDVLLPPGRLLDMGLLVPRSSGMEGFQ